MTISSRIGFEKLTPYDPGKTAQELKREYGLQNICLLSANENPLGCSEKVVEAIKNNIENVSRYPDGRAYELRAHIAEKLGLEPDMILHSNGLEEMIYLISATYMDRGYEAIMSNVTFGSYKSSTIVSGGKPIIVDNVDNRVNLDGFIDSITDKTKLIWVCNPNNPTGTFLTAKEIESFLEKVPENVLVLLDEAYREYATASEFPHDSLKYLKQYDNLLIMRTFSKCYGLAGMRVGYTMGNPKILNEINKARTVFNVSVLSQAAAIAAFDDQEFVKMCCEKNDEWKEYLLKEFNKMGITYAPSQTNHVFADVKKDAVEVCGELLKRGVKVLPMMGSNVRFSVGTQEENEYVIKALKEIL